MSYLQNLTDFQKKKLMNPRALYFGVGSDLFEEQYLNIFIFLGNVFLVEMLIILTNKYFLNFERLNKWLVK